MDSLVILALRIVLLVLLWLLILVALRTMRGDVKAASGGVGVAGPATGMPAAPAPRASRRTGPPRQLAVVDGPMTGSTLDVSGGSEVVMGRSSDCAFVLGDDYASGRHARLFKRGPDWFVEDLDSRNGTFVGGFRIDQPEQVQAGTDIRIGRTTVRLEP